MRSSNIHYRKYRCLLKQWFLFIHLKSIRMLENVTNQLIVPQHYTCHHRLSIYLDLRQNHSCKNLNCYALIISLHMTRTLSQLNHMIYRCDWNTSFCWNTLFHWNTSTTSRPWYAIAQQIVIGINLISMDIVTYLSTMQWDNQMKLPMKWCGT
jgi:hypothetical protein